MEIILYIYFGINLFVSGYWFNENSRFESNKYTFIFLVLSLLFGVIGIVFYCFLILFSPIFNWLSKEVKFQYRFYFTDYWDKIVLDDNYSEEYKSREEKLKRMTEISQKFGKQSIRHNKQIQKKYGKS